MKPIRPFFLSFLLIGTLTTSCQRDSSTFAGSGETEFFAKGADISWATEMGDKGMKFYTHNLKEMECTALFREIGFNSVRFRVWVDPKDGYCGKEDVLRKCRKAQALGMSIMIDFHYSDWWADPQKQYVPKEWEGQSVEEMAQSVARHTSSTLKYLKDNGINIAWVQVGNEVENGILWESGRVQGSEAENFAKYFNAGASAVRQTYPQAKVILHISNAWKMDTLTWFYDLMKANNVNFDIIGLSLYPSYWENGAYPDWGPKTQSAVVNFSQLHNRYGKEVMLVEFGMPASEPDKAKACLQYILDNTSGKDWFKGIFLWEPESEKNRNGYEYGAFNNGRPTSALDPFRQ